jgi:hypothetical protein
MFYRARWHDNTQGKFIQEDPIGFAGGINKYSYVGGNPLSGIDPLGLDCIAVGNSVTCTPLGGHTVTFPRPPGWPEIINGNSENYHIYNTRVNADCINPADLRKAIADAPTPGSPSPATPQGTANNATPYGLNAIVNNPVLSYLMSNGVVVNVTQPGHHLFPGYVQRAVEPVGNGSVVNNFGEGTGWLQSPSSPFAKVINGVWNGQTQGIINGLKKRCGCQNGGRFGGGGSSGGWNE